ncbi:uncharacterized protein TRUGW13939_06426 [Talaromyces rugulosus]|uniref:Uncharacterized protein n=1 Tax=Talaromyces rugulosus TaxID=121627 RepID=A0A7H8QYT6_TALRU|nr:uncharacterized protein TRUGW13939_06426 [Talaromyces rugulosus]QKX59294.1 hypothetical protein TRUGW13939_06426 [Talaromyces rugulosus]
MQTLKTWTETCCVTALDNFKTNREAYYANPEATLYIGSASSQHANRSTLPPVALSISDVHECNSAAETALGANKNQFSYAMTEVRELTGWGGKSPESLSGDEKNDATQTQNISSSATVVDDTSYLLGAEAGTNQKVKEEVDMIPNMAWKAQSLGFGDENSQIHSTV